MLPGASWPVCANAKNDCAPVVAQPGGFNSQLELSVFASRIKEFAAWMSSDFTLPPPYIGRVLYQSSDSSLTAPSTVRGSVDSRLPVAAVSLFSLLFRQAATV